MWDDNDIQQGYVQFRFFEDINGVERNISFNVRKNAEYYPELLYQFKLFLQAMGFNYIDSLVAYDEHGEQMMGSEDS